MKNTKPFDLELAKAGHPLILSNGEIVSYIGVSPLEPGKCIIVADRQKLVFINSIKAPQDGIELLLDTSEPWEAPMKQGDIVLQRSGSKWKETIFVLELPNNKILIYNDDMDSYERGCIDEEEDFEIVEKKDIKSKPTESDIEITIKVNGEFISLKDISEETLLKIRNSK